MVSDESITTLIARPFTLYSLRVVPLWDGDVERIELGNDLPAIIDRITRDRSINAFIGSDPKPMRFCQLEQEEAITLLHSGKTYYARERTPVWKVMVPASGVYSRETILSCMTRVAGRNVEKYENVLFLYPKTREFYSYSSSEIRPVDDTVFVIEHQTR